MTPGGARPLKVLFVVTTSLTWPKMRGHGFLTLHDWVWALRQWGAEVEVLPSCFLESASLTFREGEFDQVWLSDLIGIYFGLTYCSAIDSHFWPALTRLAPVRVAFETETLVYQGDYPTPDSHPDSHLNRFLRRLPFITHVLANDESVEHLLRDVVHVRWLPVCASRRWFDTVPLPVCEGPVFAGSLYPMRIPYYERVRDVVAFLNTDNNNSQIEEKYASAISGAMQTMRACRSPVQRRGIVRNGAQSVIGILEREFQRYLEALSQSTVVVDLPSYTKGLVHRPVEAIAAGRPIVTPEMQDRPLASSLLTSCPGVATYGTPDELRCILLALLEGDPDSMRATMEDARAYARLHFAAERRIDEVMRWIESTGVPQEGTASGEDVTLSSVLARR